jgi:hypothetical protein
MSEIYPILCGKCNVVIERGFERDGDLWMACPVCGQEDRMDDIVRETAEYKIDKQFRGMFGGIPDSPNMTSNSPPQRQYRWIVGE